MNPVQVDQGIGGWKGCIHEDLRTPDLDAEQVQVKEEKRGTSFPCDLPAHFTGNTIIFGKKHKERKKYINTALLLVGVPACKNVHKTGATQTSLT